MKSIEARSVFAQTTPPISSRISVLDIGQYSSTVGAAGHLDTDETLGYASGNIAGSSGFASAR